MLTSESCLLNPNRNPSLGKKEIEDRLKKFLGAKQILWLGEGIAGDDTDGHIDDMTRFVGPDTIVTAVEEDVNDENFRPLRDNFDRLRKMKNPEGQPFKIVTIPMPRPLYFEKMRLPASYANFYIGNEVVLAPVFEDPKDGEALEILKGVFPNRRIVGIDSRELLIGLGGVHCVTQQQPSLFIP